MNKERGEQPEPNILEKLNDEMRRLSPNPYEYPTVEGLAATLHLDMFTLTHWLEKDNQFKEGLETVKRVYEELKEEGEEPIDLAGLTFGVVLVLEETKKRYTV